MLKFELQSSRSVYLNRNDAPGPMVATRASGGCSGTELILTKIYHKFKNKKEAGGSGGGGPPLSKLQDVLLLGLLLVLRGTFIKRIS